MLLVPLRYSKYMGNLQYHIIMIKMDKFMKKLKFITALTCGLVISGCGSNPTTKQKINTFDSYNNSESKSEFCMRNSTLEMRKQECINNLTIYIRSKEACNKSINDKYCLTRNQNRWDNFNLQMSSAISAIGGKLDVNAFDKTMIEQSTKFQLTCLNSSKKLISCSEIN
jgi:hypothetical protein